MTFDRLRELVARAMCLGRGLNPDMVVEGAACWEHYLGSADRVLSVICDAACGLHESVDCASDMERLRGDPGAGAMGAVIEYRDRLRRLLDRSDA